VDWQVLCNLSKIWLNLSGLLRQYYLSLWEVSFRLGLRNLPVHTKQSINNSTMTQKWLIKSTESHHLVAFFLNSVERFPLMLLTLTPHYYCSVPTTAQNSTWIDWCYSRLKTMTYHSTLTPRYHYNTQSLVCRYKYPVTLYWIFWH